MLRLLCIVLLCPLTTLADVTVPDIFGDNMVIQRNATAPIWGWANVGEEVTVTGSWNNQPVTATANRYGRWSANLTTPEAGGPHTITIEAGNTLTIRGILAGEVWLCSGQSNMEMPLANIRPGYTGVDNAEQEIAAAVYPAIRLFNVPNRVSVHERVDCPGSWQPCSPETARTFSATAYFFARKLHTELGVPIGVITADWGGTVAEAWMSREALSEFPEFSSSIEWLEAVGDPNKRGTILEDMTERWWNTLNDLAPGGQDWNTLGYNDDAWNSMNLPASWSGPELGGHDGIVYFRKTVRLPASAAGKAGTVELGPIDDQDDVWVNGTHVGGVRVNGRWNQPRRYDVPADLLREGDNVVAVRAFDTGGIGGINGTPDQMKLTAGGQSVSLSGPWQWSKGPSVSELPPRPEGAEIGPNTPSVLFGGMIAPVAPMRLAGTIWYQGESNRGRAAQYRTLFPALIENWRSVFNTPDLPFYFVQIAPFRYRGDTGQTAMLREAQAKALELPATGMAVTLDIGDPIDIHPTNKQDVGKRLALLALSGTYDKDIEAHGPVFTSMRREGPSVRVNFDHAEGLRAGDKGLRWFFIAGSDRVFRRARARIDGTSVVVSNPNVPDPVAVRYAWFASPEGDLFNAAGLPAAPFRTDAWEGKLPDPVNDDEMSSYRTREPGFRDIFNGENLDGWHIVNAGPETWQVRDNMIICSGVPTGVMRTDKQYQNFILEMEYRHMVPGGNAGLFVWSDPIPKPGQPFTRSVEVQVMDGLESDWYTSDGDIFPIHGATMTPDNGRGGNRAFPIERRANLAPLWNHYRVECIDGNISLAINGKVVTTGRDCSPRMGYICLESEGTPIHFRNIRVREITATEALPAEHRAETAKGFKPLYNGVNFDGWKFGPEHEGHWRATDWTISFDGGGADLWTEASYGDFQLIADWRWTGEPKPTMRPVILPSGETEANPDGTQKTIEVQDAGDSGIYLRGSSKSQINIWCWPIGSGEVYGYRTDAAMSPDVRAGVTPSVVADAPIGQWNRFIITMKGDRLTVDLNGKRVLDEAQLPGVAPEGPIALQMHGGALQFANLYIRELD